MQIAIILAAKEKLPDPIAICKLLCNCKLMMENLKPQTLFISDIIFVYCYSLFVLFIFFFDTTERRKYYK